MNICIIIISPPIKKKIHQMRLKVSFITYFLVIIWIRYTKENDCQTDVTLCTNGVTGSQGLVYYKHNGIERAACADTWNYDSTTVLCRGLGFENASPRRGFAEVADHMFNLTNFFCNGKESFLSNCNCTDYPECKSGKAVWVACKVPMIKDANCINQSSDMLVVAFQLPMAIQCYLDIRGYHVRYQVKDSLISDANIIYHDHILSSHEQTTFISNLEPNTTYTIEIAIIYESFIGPYSECVFGTTDEVNMQAVLSGPSGPHCYGVTIELICQYPRLSQNGYFSSPFWQKDGKDLAPDGNIERSITVSSTETTLIIRFQQDRFPNDHYNYSCYLLKKETYEKVISNTVSVYLYNVPSPANVTYRSTSKTIQLYWDYSTTNCYIEYNAYFKFNITLEGLESKITSAKNVTLTELNPDKEYNVNIVAFVDRGHEWPGTITSRSVRSTAKTLGKPIVHLLNSLNSLCHNTKVFVSCNYQFDQLQPGSIKSIHLFSTNFPNPLTSTTSYTDSTATLEFILSSDTFEDGLYHIYCFIEFAETLQLHSDESNLIGFEVDDVFPPNVMHESNQNSISLQLIPDNKCSVACSLSYDITWFITSSSDFKGIETNKTSYTINDLLPATNYTIEIWAFCKENISFASQTIHLAVATSMVQPTSNLGYALDPGEIAAIAVGSIISLVVILAIIIILTLSFRYLWKKRTHIYMYNTRSSEDILQPNSQG